MKIDSSKIISKLLEINSQEIKYNRFDNLESPIYVISKNEVAYVIYSNGIKESFHTKPVLANNNKYLSKKDSLVKTFRVKDYIKFNIQLGAIVNNNYSNVQRKQPTLSHTSSESYSSHNSDLYNYNVNLGFNFLFGRSPYVKHILGVNYLHSRGEYEYNYGQGGYTSYQKDLRYISHVDYLNFVTGVQFSIGRHIKIEPQISFNAAINVNEKINGTSKTTTVSGGPTPYVLDYEVTVHKDEKVKSENISSTISLTPKISYEFKIKQNTFGVYLSYNLAYQYRLPWYMAGITYYPFKKLSQPIEMKSHNSNDQIKKNLKIIHNPKLNFDLGIVANNGYTNTDEAYSEKKPENPKEYELGYNFGMNFNHGKSSYFKHFVMASLIESQAKLLKRTYNYTYDPNYTYETVNTTQYDSRVLFFNIGTGIKFVMFKHLYFDNGLALNLPIYSTNEIQYDKTYNQWDKFYTTKINSVSDPTIKNKSNEFLIKKTHLILLAKIGYEFNIKKNRFGAFVGWNFNLNKIGQWHLIGITYYPFKKLR